MAFGPAPQVDWTCFERLRTGTSFSKQLAIKDWRRGIREAHSLGDAAVTTELIEDPDLHDHLLKGLYEAHLSP